MSKEKAMRQYTKNSNRNLYYNIRRYFAVLAGSNKKLAMFLNPKHIVFLCILFLLCIALCSCSGRESICNDINKSSQQSIDDKPEAKTTIRKTTLLLKLDDIKFSDELTKDRILSDWGLPYDIVGPLFEHWIYKMKDGRLLWLLFSWNEPYPLLKAIIAYENPEGRKILFDSTNEKKLAVENASKPSKRRADRAMATYITSPKMACRKLRLNDIKLSAQLTRVQVLFAWGLPDEITGSGFEYLNYKLENGQKLSFLFAGEGPGPLLSAIIYAHAFDFNGRIIFDGWDETKLR